MKNSKKVLVGLGLLISTSCFSQSSSEYGIGVTTDNDQRVFFNYTRDVNDNYALNFRLSQGWQIDKRYAGGETLYGGGTTPMQREVFISNETILQSKLAVGPEFQIKESNFYWGVEAVIGYRHLNFNVIKNTHNLTLLNMDPVVTALGVPAEKVETWFSDKSHFLTAGIQSRFSVKAFATNKLGLNIFGELGIDYNILVDTNTFYADETSFNSVETDVAIDFPQNLFIPRARLGASLFLFR